MLLLHVKTQRVDTLSGDRGNGQFSPDGRWLVYTAREGGREEIFAVSYPALQNKQQISRSGGRLPFWSAQSGELFFITGDTLMATTVSTRGELDWTAPKPLFRSGDLMDLDYRISATADGRRFLLPTRNPDAAATEIQVVFNWFDVLRAGGKR
ncbi:MAG: PD40 domain-containing protein [Gemmatimonadales bacterium]|nr:PD40 domain-containing protein [Gemmatimonadales bacterium]